MPDRRTGGGDDNMTERLQKLISASGLMSRRAAEDCISAGRVSVNGKTAELGCKADIEIDNILVDGRPLPSVGDKVYIMLNKPRGYVTTLSDEKGRKNVSELVRDIPQRVYPVGRLDMYSEGLLLLTNDGDFANRMMHPSHEVKKTYMTWVQGDNIDAAAEMLRGPMALDGFMTAGAEVHVRERFDAGAVLEITIHEGKNRQIRRMCEKAGLKVTKLRRISEGGVSLGELKSGKWRRLTEAELGLLCAEGSGGERNERA